MALSATVQFDVRTTGNDANGGGFDPGVASPGSDYSQQSSPQVVFSDLVIGATNTQLTSALSPFSSASVGNLINVTGGTGFTTGRYEILSVSGITATMDRAVGTAASIAGTGNLGGSLLTIAAAVTAAATSNTVNIQAGTYTLTSTIVIPNTIISLIGYQTAHNDGGTKPLITTATNSTALIETTAASGYQTFSNLSLSNTAGTTANGIFQGTTAGFGVMWTFIGCIFNGFDIGINSSSSGVQLVGFINIINTEISNCTAYALDCSSGGAPFFTKIFGSYFNGNAEHLWIGGSNGPVWIEKSIFAGSTGTIGLQISATVGAIDQCTFFNNTNPSGVVNFGGNLTSVTNCIFYGNPDVALVGESASFVPNAAASHSNAFGSNGTNYSSWAASPGDVTLTANPFTASGSGDFSLNSAAGGGSACKGAGFPGVFPGGTSTGHVDIGAVQSMGGGGGSSGGSYTFLG